MPTLNTTHSLSGPCKQSRKLIMPLFVLLAICLSGQGAEAKYGGGSNTMASAETSTYMFLSDQSAVVQTGGLAGVHETYSIEGQFRLIIDFDTGMASFDLVDANLVDESPFLPTQSLGELFNMAALVGTVVDETTIEFEGKTADGTNTDILLRLTFRDDSVHLTGRTVPPPNSADFFIFELDAVAWKKYGGGTGEPNDPYLIYTAEQMNTIGAEPNDWDKHFKLMADIDLSSYNGTDFNIIGTSYDNPFTGVFDGNGHTISNFSYTSTDENYIGLFGYISGENTKIKDLGLIDPNIDAGTGDPVGSLVGDNGGTITNCYAEGGSVSGQGGLVGENFGTITNCYFTGSVLGISCVGGLVGWNYWLFGPGIISECYSTGNVSGNKTVGGLVGCNWSAITNCYAANKVSGNEQVGGLVGSSEEISSTIANCYFLAPSDGGGPDNGQGLPLTDEQMKQQASFIDWDFVGKPDGPHDIWAEPVGGGYPILWWQLSPLPELPFWSGKGEPNDPYLISTADELNSIGHNPRLMAAHFKLINDIDLAGIDLFIIGSELFPFTGVFDGNGHTISNFNYTSTDIDYVGLFGYVKDPKVEIRDLGLISPNINSGERWAIVGSLVGYFEGGTISNCYAEGGSVTGFSRVGGLVGWIDGSITNCHSSTSVSGIDDVGGLVGLVGGLVGSNKYTGIISDCYSTGSVSGDRPVGGLVGANLFGHIANCYATASVAGNEYVGGLVGLNWNIIKNCYSTGNVSGNETVGGLVGDNERGEVTDSFWDIQTSGQIRSAGGTGKTTAEMQTESTFTDAGWDFVGESANGTEDIWWILEGQDYPRLCWELDEEDYSVVATENRPGH